MKTYNIHFHPVWEQKLTGEQKQRLIHSLSAVPFVENELTTKAVIAKYKENGGFVTTVLLNNGYSHLLRLNNIFVKVTNHENELIAEGKFNPQLSIEAFSSQPWSFVFSNDMVKIRKAEIQQINVEVIYDG
ncbi:SLAP domain-containing protein [Bacillus sp. N9]